MLHPERKLNRVTEEGRGLALPAQRTERCPVPARPPTVRPGANRNMIARILSLRQLLNRPIRPPRTKQILGVVIPTRLEHGRCNLREVRANVTRLPERIVVRMLHHQIPERRRLFREPLSRPRPHGAHLEEERVGIARHIGPIVLRVRAKARVPRCPPIALIKREIGPQVERAVVKEIVSLCHVGHRRLGRTGLERRMRVNAARRRVKPRIRRPVDPDLAVVVRKVLDQPLDGVVGITALVHILGTGLHILVRRHLGILPFRVESPACVLVHKNESRLQISRPVRTE